MNVPTLPGLMVLGALGCLASGLVCFAAAGALLLRHVLRYYFGRGPVLPSWQSKAGTELYNAARELCDATIGHTDDCEWHTNGQAFCSCVAYGAACAGVEAVIDRLGGWS